MNFSHLIKPFITLFLIINIVNTAYADRLKGGRATDSFEEESIEQSPKRGWDDVPSDKEEDESPSTLRQIALWLPNRILDLIDIFRIDLGVGPAAGGVIRITPHAQAGIRTMAPTSLRVGDFGRDVPFKLEHSNEFGIGPAFVQSKDREVCPGEVGIGLDLFLIGGYGGLCFDELADFVGGIFTYDMKDDDLK